MNPIELILNPQSGLLRSGWRAVIFIALLSSPYLIYLSIPKNAEPTRVEVIAASRAMILTYAVLVLWVAAVSWICLRFLERMKISSLGFAPHGGWFGDVLKGCAIGALMISSVVAMQVAGGGSRLSFNPILRAEQGAINWAGARTIAAAMAGAIALLVLAAAFEELMFRGYAFQTILRGAPAVVPILLFSFYFGWAHWNNPSRTLFSTANTALAGVWLSIAYLRTRNLWFPTALHFMWNWTMGAFFGIPVSGLAIENSLLVTSSHGPVWLTGGSYGSEGGAAATVALVIAIIVIWRARWLSVSPEMSATLSERAPDSNQ
ncbi:MAG: CPBP family intramembrane metalloprotease [Blastocatellia bacterium]|nr:CPBP family intramembrane metalloprotease [Blastocatellia bacterium]